MQDKAPHSQVLLQNTPGCMSGRSVEHPDSQAERNVLRHLDSYVTWLSDAAPYTMLYSAFWNMLENANQGVGPELGQAFLRTADSEYMLLGEILAQPPG